MSDKVSAAREKAELEKLAAETEKVKLDALKLKADLEEARVKLQEVEAGARKAKAEALTAEHDEQLRAISLRDRERTEKLVTLGDYYHHHYLFDAPVDDRSVRSCLATLSAWHREDPECEMNITINSPGGSVIDGFHLFDQLSAYSLRGPMERMAHADPAAMKVNRYFERGLFSEQLNDTATLREYVTLHSWLEGNTLAGSNPKFDADYLSRQRWFDAAWGLSKKFGTPWHHRLLDLSAYAAGVLGIPPDELPGLNVVCEKLGVVNEEPHSALGDARATAECFRLLRDYRKGKALIGFWPTAGAPM